MSKLLRSAMLVPLPVIHTRACSLSSAYTNKKRLNIMFSLPFYIEATGGKI